MRALGIGFILAVATLASMGSARVIVGGGTGDIDLDRDGRTDLIVSAGAAHTRYLFNSGASIQPASGSDLRFTQTALGAGATVDGSMVFSGGGFFEEASAHIDAFDPLGILHVDMPGGDVAGSYGFSFTSGGATHYGWADVGVHADPYVAAAGIEWAYESDPNTPITVGAVPEPASVSLLLVAAPALFLRRRRLGSDHGRLFHARMVQLGHGQTGQHIRRRLGEDDGGKDGPSVRE